MKPARKGTQKSDRTPASHAKKSAGFSAEERAAMRERAKELKAAAGKESDESAVLAKIAEMPEPDRTMGQRLHALIRENAPELLPRLWYGMPAYAKDGNVVCFFQNAQKFKTRFSTLGFSDKARLDDGHMWPTSYALMDLTKSDEAAITELVRKAVS
jgi:hypothetical protein